MFWRSVEGVSTMDTDIVWATSQACPLRRSTITGSLALSDAGFSSGGFLADVSVGGHLSFGTQQQYFVRNAELGGTDPSGSMNLVFVGVEGAPGASMKVSNVQRTPVVAEKPYLVEDQGVWRIHVPSVRTGASGTSPLSSSDIDIPMYDVFVARDGDTADKINQGIQGKKALLLTPAIYGLDEPIYIVEPGFVVLGVGFPTLVATSGNSAIVVEAPSVRLAHVLLEAGTSKEMLGEDEITNPLLHWIGHHGVLSDIFARVGSFSYARSFKASCLRTRADVMLQIDGSNSVLDNSWLWHADHDDCPVPTEASDSFIPRSASDSCSSGNGFVANGMNITAYALMSEHTHRDLVSWNGDYGSTFFFQSELPYHDLTFGRKYVGYRVGYHVRHHYALGIGVYAIGSVQADAGIRAPPTTHLERGFVWVITGSVNQFKSVACLTPGSFDCVDVNSPGTNCDGGRACYVSVLADVVPTRLRGMMDIDGSPSSSTDLAATGTPKFQHEVSTGIGLGVAFAVVVFLGGLGVFFCPAAKVSPGRSEPLLS